MILFTPVQSLTKHSRQARVFFDESVDIPYSEYKLHSSSNSVSNNRQSKASYPIVIPNPQSVASNSSSNVISIGLNVNLALFSLFFVCTKSYTNRIEISVACWTFYIWDANVNVLWEFPLETITDTRPVITLVYLVILTHFNLMQDSYKQTVVYFTTCNNIAIGLCYKAFRIVILAL